MTFVNSTTVRQLIFKGRDLVQLLIEIAKFFESHTNVEKYVDDLLIIWDNESNTYIASIYVNDVKVD